MTATLCRFLMLQGLLLWHGGFLFYTSIVVPLGTAVHGAFGQGRVTRDVTHALNVISLVVLLVFAFGQWRDQARRGLWLTWLLLLLSVAGLWYWHGRVDATVDFVHGTIADYPRFYFRHRVYLYGATVQWLLGLVYTWQLLMLWRPSTSR